MTEFSSEELLHERLMSDDGAEKYYSQVALARAREANGVTIPGRALIRRYLRPVEKEIEEQLKRAREVASTYGMAVRYMKNIKPAVASMIGVSLMVDRMFTAQSTAAWARTIGDALEDEDRFAAMKKKDPAMWRDLEKRTKALGSKRKKRHIQQRGRTVGSIPPRWPLAARMSAGGLVLAAILDKTDLVDARLRNRNGKTGQIRIVEVTENAVKWIREADEHAAGALAVYRPMLEKPIPWTGAEGGGYKTDLVLRRGLMRCRGKRQSALLKAVEPEQYSTVLSGVNHLQDTGWQVNAPVLEVASDAIDRGGAPLQDLVRLPIPPVLAKDATEEEWKVRNTKAREIRRLNDIRDGKNILVGNTLRAARAVEGRTFYLPHRLDFRGRAYPTPHWIQPQGPDIARGLLKFAEPDPLTPEGWDALMLWGKELDLDTENLDLARAVYRDPLEHSEAWSKLSDPWQALAWLLEVGEALDVGYPHRPFLTSLPVYIDASNNGLQLYSLLTGCRDLAAWTNVLPGSKQDLYTRVGDLAWKRVLASYEDPDHWGHKYAADLVRLLDVGGIPRDCAKRPVMTMPYNVTPWSATNYVRDWYTEAFCAPGDPYGPLEYSQKSPRFLSKCLMGAVKESCPAAVAGMGWLAKLADACSSQGIPLRWTTPAGFPVQQEYRETKKRMVQVHLGGSVRQIHFYEEEGKADPERQRTAAAPNYVHGVDASVMVEAAKNFDGPLAAIHDAFGTTASRVPQLHRTLREAVVAMTIDRRPFDDTKASVESYSHTKVPEPPRFGVIHGEEILASTHMFS
jgi:DNA-directed RNA polymerase